LKSESSSATAESQERKVIQYVTIAEYEVKEELGNIVFELGCSDTSALATYLDRLQKMYSLEFIGWTPHGYVFKEKEKK